MQTLQRHKGSKLVVSDDFSGTNADLNGVRGWVKVTGAAISESGGYARCSTTNTSSIYLNTTNGYNRNREVYCEVDTITANVSAGIYLTCRNSALTKNYFAVYHYRSGANDVLAYVIATGGVPSGGTIATMLGNTTRDILIRRSGDNIVVVCTSGSVRWTYSLVGNVDFSDNDLPGLYYVNNNLFGFGNQALWDNFSCRLYPQL